MGDYMPNDGDRGHPLITDLEPPEYVLDGEARLWRRLGSDYHLTEYTDTPFLVRGTEGTAVAVARAGRIPAVHAQSSQDVPSADWTPVTVPLLAGVSNRLLSADPSRLTAHIRVRGTGTDGVWLKNGEFNTPPNLTTGTYDPTAIYLPQGQTETLPFNGAVYACADGANAAVVYVSASVYRF